MSKQALNLPHSARIGDVLHYRAVGIIGCVDYLFVSPNLILRIRDWNPSAAPTDAWLERGTWSIFHKASECRFVYTTPMYSLASTYTIFSQLLREAYGSCDAD